MHILQTEAHIELGEWEMTGGTADIFVTKTLVLWMYDVGMPFQVCQSVMGLAQCAMKWKLENGPLRWTGAYLYTESHGGLGRCNCYEESSHSLLLENDLLTTNWQTARQADVKFKRRKYHGQVVMGSMPISPAKKGLEEPSRTNDLSWRELIL